MNVGPIRTNTSSIFQKHDTLAHSINNQFESNVDELLKIPDMYETDDGDKTKSTVSQNQVLDKRFKTGSLNPFGLKSLMKRSMKKKAKTIKTKQWTGVYSPTIALQKSLVN